MPMRNKTIRRLPAQSRKLARLINKLDSTLTRLKHFLPAVEEMEHDSHALYNRLSTYEKKAFAQAKQDEAATTEAERVIAQQLATSAGPLFTDQPAKPVCATCIKACKNGINAEFPDSCTQYEGEHESNP